MSNLVKFEAIVFAILAGISALEFKSAKSYKAKYNDKTVECEVLKKQLATPQVVVAPKIKVKITKSTKRYIDVPESAEPSDILDKSVAQTQYVEQVDRIVEYERDEGTFTAPVVSAPAPEKKHAIGVFGAVETNKTIVGVKAQAQINKYLIGGLGISRDFISAEVLFKF